MTTLIVPPLDKEPWPTLGPQVCDFIEETCIYGPGSLKGQPAVLDPEKRAAIYRAYEVFPKGHPYAGRRRFKRVGLSWRKGTAKTEFAAWIAFVELHPDGPVRCDGFDANGNPVGRPVNDPYIPMVAYTEEQVEELAYGALYVVASEGPEADLFDIGLNRIIRLDARGRAAGKAVPLSGSPNARDGARTTFQHFDETHRLNLPNLMSAYETMQGNIPKRPLEDPWSMETTTAGQPGQPSIAENTHMEALSIEKGDVDEPDLFYFHREASPGYDMSSLDDRIKAISEATGPVGEYGPGQFRDIAKQWDRPGADRPYLERVWLNRWVPAEAQAFNLKKWNELADPKNSIPRGATVVAGFDGARFQDATALVMMDVHTGLTEIVGLWERPPDAAEWEVPEREVSMAVEDMFNRYVVYKLYCDPPHWTETVANWAAKWPDQVEEWWTTYTRKMAGAIRGFVEAIDSQQISHTGNDSLSRHVGNAGRHDTNLVDEEGKQLWVLRKIHRDRKFDAAMATVLANQARLDAIRDGVTQMDSFVPQRIW